jgi:hypothetical protein
MKFPIITPKKSYSNLRKIVSCPGNLEKYKIEKIVSQQTMESLIEESIEYSSGNGDPSLKLITFLCLSLINSIKSSINYNIFQGKMKEIIIRMVIQYVIHELFYIVKTISY